MYLCFIDFVRVVISFSTRNALRIKQRFTLPAPSTRVSISSRKVELRASITGTGNKKETRF